MDRRGRLLSVFQSTHPRGVRPLEEAARPWVMRVSIHAPAWGATRRKAAIRRAGSCFNPRTRVGCDALFFLQKPVYAVFQSTHPRGVRRRCKRMAGGQHMFQSTHPRGVRPVPVPQRYRTVPVSIHAPAWGATCRQPTVTRCGYGFNPRTRVGCDQSSQNHRNRYYPCFNPRTRVGCDILSMRKEGKICCFNPRTRVGCDFLARLMVRDSVLFQSTHPRGVRLFPCFIQ